MVARGRPPIGDDNPNTLISDGPGADHVDGRGGDDRVIGGAGDRVSGGDGDDVVSASLDSVDDPGADRPAHLLGDGGEDYLSGPTNAVLDCGPGEDAIRLPTYLEVRAGSDETSCEFYADQRGVAEPLWIGRDLRVLEDAFEVVLKWRRRAPAAFVARATWGPATELVRAEARGTLAPGVSTIRLPLTGPGANRLPRDCSVLLSVTSQRASSSLFGSWLPFGPCVPSSPEAA